MDSVELELKIVSSKDALNVMPKNPGNLIILNTVLGREIYYDETVDSRKDITSSCIVFDTKQKLLDNKNNKLINKVYIVLEDSTIYRSDGDYYILIHTSKSLSETITGLTELDPIALIKDNVLEAPVTSSDQVILDDGDTLDAVLTDTNLLQVTRTKHVYLDVKEDAQKIFDIRFPKDNYNFDNGDLMAVIIHSALIETTRYEISDSCLILGDSVDELRKGENILIIFYYSMLYDANNAVKISGNNIEDFSITTNKVADSFRMSADKISETLKRIFFTREEQDKLKGIEANATHYVHPDTHPASMIIQDETHRFLTDNQIIAFNAKADADSVYNKDDIDSKFENIIDGAPEELNTLNEISESLNNDPDFAGTMVKELDKKATSEDLKNTNDLLSNKADVDDYIRNTVYSATARTKDKLGKTCIYTLKLDDKEFEDYVDGMSVTLKIDATNDSASLLKINELDAKPILTQDGYDVVAGELKAGSIYSLRYNATSGNFILQGKGGVIINDTTQPYFTIKNGESITRGDLVDIVNNEAMKSVLRSKILSRNFTTESKFGCNGKTKIIAVSSTEFVVFWKNNSELYVQKFIYQNGYVMINSSTGTYMTANGSCIDFDVKKVSDRMFLLVTSDNLKVFTAMTITIDADQFVFGDKYTRQETSDITNPIVFYLGNNKSIMAWQSGANTRTVYVKTDTTAITVISNRDNIDYPLDNACLVGNSQIIFAKPLSDNRIRKWTMNITSNDFYNSTLTYIVDDNTSEIFKDPIAITDIGNNKVMMITVNAAHTKQYTWEVSVDPDRGSEIKNTYISTRVSYIMNSYIIPEFLRISSNKPEYVSVSKYNNEAPTIGDENQQLQGPDCMKIEISKFIEGTQILDINSDINIMSDYVSFDMLNSTTLGIVFSYNNQLCFIIVKISKEPDAVALQPGNGGDSIKVMKWN